MLSVRREVVDFNPLEVKDAVNVVPVTVENEKSAEVGIPQVKKTYSELLAEKFMGATRYFFILHAIVVL